MTESAADLPATISSLAEAHGLELEESSIKLNEMGLDFRVAIARTIQGDSWVLRMPRRSDVLDRAAVEGRLLRMVAPHLSVAVPDWRIQTSELTAYPLLPGEPGLELTEAGEPEWQVDVSSPEFADSLGDLLAELHSVDAAAAEATGIESKKPDEIRESWRSDIAKVAAEFDVAPHLTARWAAWLNEDSYWPDWSVLTHGEIYPGHTLVAQNRITGVLDWTTASVGDPAKDFMFHQATASAEAFARTVDRYVARGGRVWPRLAEHCAEMFSASPVAYGIYALLTGEDQHLQAAAAQLNPSTDT